MAELEILWSKRAKNQFDSNVKYLLKYWSPKVADNFILKTFSLIDILKTFPKIGRMQIKDKNIRAFLFIKQISVFIL